MAKVFTDKPVKTLGRVANLISGKDPKDKAVIKAQELSKVRLDNFSINGYEVTIIRQPEYDESRGIVIVWVEAYKDGQRIYVNNPLEYYNPPIMVPDGTWHKKVIGEKEIDIQNMKEDLVEALKIIIVEAIKTIDRK